MISLKITKWLNNQKKKNKLSVKIINLNKIDKWTYDNDTISHKSKKFFKIIGIKVLSNFYKTSWDQPIIKQNEVGVLGIIKDKKSKKYLLQAKVEPGNINKLQLAPSVQATKSNYTGVHGGLKVPYIDYFLKTKKKINFNQSEQGFRYYKKFNSNILINNIKNFKKASNYYWFTKKEIMFLLKKKNIINMDTISVLSTSLKKKTKDFPVNKFKNIKLWIKILNNKYYIKTKIIKLNQLKDWIISNTNIKHKKLKHFSILGISVKTSKREINNWEQPIIKGKPMAFAGIIKSKINETDHYLFRYLLKPGLKKSVFGCTINTSDISIYKKRKLNQFEKIFFSRKERQNVIYENILSDEGGRFYHCQIKYNISFVNYEKIKTLPKNYIWISYNQVIDMIKEKRLDIESRLLFACDNIKNLK